MHIIHDASIGHHPVEDEALGCFMHGDREAGDGQRQRPPQSRHENGRTTQSHTSKVYKARLSVKVCEVSCPDEAKS